MHHSSNFVATVDPSVSEKLKTELLRRGFEIAKPQYTLFQAKKPGITCTLYTSGKLVVQGKEKDELILYYLEPEILGTFTYAQPKEKQDTSPHIGVDESGKGDFFGPLCTAAVYADEKGIEQLIEWNVCDSKKIPDPKIRTLAASIRSHFPYSELRILPEKYNALYLQFRNLNALLGWCHATVIGDLARTTSCTKALIDQFAKEEVVASQLRAKSLHIDLKQMHRAESDPIVAAASILARASFLEEMDKLSKSIGIELPKGASKHVLSAGRRIAQERGVKTLDTVSKSHFTTREKILSRSFP